MPEWQTLLKGFEAGGMGSLVCMLTKKLIKNRTAAYLFET